MKPKLIIVGAGGRMGKRIVCLAAECGRFDIIGAVEAKGHPDTGKDAGLLAGAGEIGVRLDSGYCAGADVVIDFSAPAVADATVSYCVENGAALVMGTTGLNDKQKAKIKAASRKIAVIYGTNMSVGMNVLFSLAGKTAKMLGEDYDIEIVEQHHRFKKDAPSGSAITLAENICKATGKDFKDSVVCGMAGERLSKNKGDIGIYSVREGDIIGIHSVTYGTTGEKIVLNHTAHNRDGFASGALRAAEWLFGKNPGLYSMADVLEIK